MAKKPPTSAATGIATTTVQAPPAAIQLDVRRYATITLMPLDVRLRAVSMTADAVALTAIESTGALETADALASALKQIETEITENSKAQLAPLEEALAAAKASAAEVLKPLLAAREALTVRVVQAKAALGYEGSTACYSQERSELVAKNSAKIPHTLVRPDKASGGTVEEKLLVPDFAAIGRCIKAGVHVPGVYEDTKTIYATKGAK